MPEDVVFTITIDGETLEFDDLVNYETEYVGQFMFNANDLTDENGEITATITTNLEGEFENNDGDFYEIVPNVATEIKLQDMGGFVYGFAYNGEIFFMFVFEDSELE